MWLSITLIQLDWPVAKKAPEELAMAQRDLTPRISAFRSDVEVECMRAKLGAPELGRL